MELSKILNGIDAKVYGQEKQISGLYHNSKEVKEGGLFFAIEGTQVDGANYLSEAVKNGAVAIVTSRDINLPKVTIVKVEDVRLAMSLMACNFYGNPSKDMLVMAVTGTNGKTTSTYMLSSILKEAGHKVGIIGTNGIVLDGKKIDSNLTTPDPIYLQKTLALFRDSGVSAMCMEVSAHALELQKTRGIMTDVALFTNLTQDHLDFFLNMENYFDAKAKLFTPSMTKYACINYDDPYGKTLFDNCLVPALSYSRESTNRFFKEADIIATNETHNNSSQSFIVSTFKGKTQIDLNLLGGFNVSNALGVIGASLLVGIDLETIKRGLKNLQRVDGRFNTYLVGGVKVIIDYAHTPDGIENILKSTREITDGKLISVFGCGGNRDKTKRSIMGQISENLADYTIITEDNPRFERPEDIASDIVKGMGQKPYSVELNRRKAIRLALSMAKAGDSVVIAGKGVEPYIDMLGVKTPYEDREVVEELINELKK